MKLFSCQACGQALYFENTRCEQCRRRLGYLPELVTLSALEEAGTTWRALADRRKRYRFCANAEYGVCNWMVHASGPNRLCRACQYNHLIPDLSVPGNEALWARLEAAKHRLIYTLRALRLDLPNRTEDPEHGLGFDFLAQVPERPVMIGHHDGLITLALHEADDAERERIRTEMGEPYRTLLGHFRHESGHVIWDRLVRDAGRQDEFREIFGDERQDYAESLRLHYENGAPADWPQNFVTAYASAHPWEDFAESCAHYLHIVDTLETARAFGLRVRSSHGLRAEVQVDPHRAGDIDQLIAAWLPLCFAMNSLSRSMGQPDIYPFVLSPAVIRKLGYIVGLVTGTTQPQSVQRPVPTLEDVG